MQAKWYFGTLIIILAFFGFNQEQKVAPNQEIVIQFNEGVSAIDAKGTLTIVKKQLQDIGVNNIKVKTLQNGQFKIAYFSVTDAASIKDILSKKNNVELDFISNSQDKNKSKFPTNKGRKAFNLDVYKIQDSTDSNTGLDGKLAVELKPEGDRFFKPNVDIYAIVIDDRQRNRVVKVAYKLNRNIAIAIDNTSHNIPEVRAGPEVYGNS